MTMFQKGNLIVFHGRDLGPRHMEKRDWYYLILTDVSFLKNGQCTVKALDEDGQEQTIRFAKSGLDFPDRGWELLNWIDLGESSHHREGY
jgi:hypothetical protein